MGAWDEDKGDDVMPTISAVAPLERAAGALASRGAATIDDIARGVAVDGPLRVAVLGTHDNPSVHNIAMAVQARGGQAHIIDLADVRKVGDHLLLGGAPMPAFDVAIGYHGAEVPTGGLAKMRAMERAGVGFVNGPAAIRVSRDKWLTAKALGDLGPRTMLVRSGDEARAGVAQIGSPTIVKLRIGTEGKGVAKVTEANEVPPVVDLITATGHNALIQEMIKMEQPSDIRAFVVDGKVVTSMERRVGVSKTGDFRTNVSNGGTAAPITLHPNDERTAVEGARRLRLGVMGGDLMGERGHMKLVEGNSGPGQKIIDVTGVDVADLIAAHVLDVGESTRAARAGAARVQA